jgi:hypothetical protein
MHVSGNLYHRNVVLDVITVLLQQMWIPWYGSHQFFPWYMQIKTWINRYPLLGRNCYEEWEML